jgi:hypothetical protein
MRRRTISLRRYAVAAMLDRLGAHQAAAAVVARDPDLWGPLAVYTGGGVLALSVMASVARLLP